jgi:mRNA interferase MazF
MTTGDILLADLNPVTGQEQGGRRPVVVVSDRRYSAIPGLFLAVPLTSTDRELPHHVVVPANSTTGLERTSFAVPEQIRALAYRRIDRQLGAVDDDTLGEISHYLHLFIA